MNWAVGLSRAAACLNWAVEVIRSGVVPTINSRKRGNMCVTYIRGGCIGEEHRAEDDETCEETSESSH